MYNEDMKTNLLSRYANKWVALTLDREKVVTSAKSVKELDKKVKTLNERDKVIYHHVLPISGSYAPQWQA